MQQSDSRVEALLEAGQRLRPQIDLRNQHHRLLACFQHAMNQLQVDLRLATSGNPRQEEGLKAVQACTHCLEGCALLRV